jgi:hypothetical protein
MPAALPAAWKPLRPHALQSQMWGSRARFLAACCGRGSGKTELARRRVVMYLPVRKPWPDPVYFYAMPTRDQCERVAWRKILQLIPPEWHARPPLETKLEVRTVFGSTLACVSMDHPERIEGTQWDGGVLDESCDIKAGAFARSVRPALSEKSGWCWRIGVPKRWGPGAREFKEVCEEWRDLPGHASFTWASRTVMTEEEVEAAKHDMDPRDFDEQYGAVWQGTSGLCFYCFDPEESVTESLGYCPDRWMLVGMDFNVDPMAWVLLQQHPETKALHAVDELWKRNTNTPQALDELWARYGERHSGGWQFYGDATSRARNTRATASDYAHVVNDRRFDKHRQKRVLIPKSNPLVVDRFAACNARFKNAAGERKLFVHPRCQHLIDDLNTRAYKEGSRSPDDYDDVGHITDALGYPVHFLYPVAVSAPAAGAVSTYQPAVAPIEAA